MNIQEAKEQIERAVKIYLMKDSHGNYRIPIERQRPVFLLGAPGIGKTAIMEQISQELDIALVSYSMTHHTRQSALGLPFIRHREYQGAEFDVSEYTMSEIIASVYEMMEKSGKKEGIRRHWLRPCCSFCSTRLLANTGSRTAGWWPRRAIRPSSTAQCGSLMW